MATEIARDEVYRTERERIGDFTFDKSVAGVFDDMVTQIADGRAARYGASGQRSDCQRARRGREHHGLRLGDGRPF